MGIQKVATVERQSMKTLISVILTLIPALCFAGDFDETDKKLFTSVCGFQVVDGLTTMSHLKNNDLNYISNDWNWKYGCKRPSSGHLWGIKTAELVGAYYIGKALPDKWRKGFFMTIDATLLFCIHNNLKAGAGISITF